MADSEFKLPASSFEEVSKIIQAYAQINKPASLGDISRRTGINPTTVSGNNRFLIAIGLIEGGKSKACTPIGKQIGDSLGHGLEEETARLFAEVVEGSEFLKNILGAVRIRKGMEEGALKAHIAYSAGLSKTPSVMTGAGSIVDLLKRSGNIVESDGKLVTSSVRIEAASAPDLEMKKIEAGGVPTAVVHRGVIASSAGINLTIEVKISVGADELDGLGEKLRLIVDQFHGTEEAE